MKRFTQLPCHLFRFQKDVNVNLRDYGRQVALGRTSFDLKTVDGMVMPMAGNTFHTPNGMSWRPKSDHMLELLEKFKGPQRVYVLHEGMTLPEGLVMFHEHSEHYSLQTTTPIKLEDFNEKLTALMEGCMSATKEQFLEAQNDEDDQDH